MPELYSTHYINIDSRNRETSDIISYSDTYHIKGDNIKVESSFIILPISLKLGQRIRINGITPIKKTLRSVILGNCAVSFMDNLIKINYPHNLTDNRNDCTITIQNFKCESEEICSLVNKEHIIFTKVREYDFSPDCFYIKICNLEKFSIPEHNFNIYFNYVGGIPINYFDNILTINNVENGSMIKIDNMMDLKKLHCDIYIKVVNKIIPGYKDAGLYRYDLQCSYKNVVQVSLVDYTIPDFSKFIYINGNSEIIIDILGCKKVVHIKDGIYSYKDYTRKVNKKVKKYNLEFNIDYNLGFVKVKSNLYINCLCWKLFNINSYGCKFDGKYDINNYFMMKIDSIDIIRNNNKEYFAKIYTNCNYNQSILKMPLLSPIDISGSILIGLYDFRDNLFRCYGYDYSFVLEVITINDSVELGNYYNKTLSNYNTQLIRRNFFS